MLHVRFVAVGLLALVLVETSAAAASAVGSAPVPPPNLGSMSPSATSSDAGQQKFVAKDARQVSLIRQRLSRAYHGAASAAQIYRSADLADGALLMAVSASSPGLFVTDQSAADLALAKPIHDVVAIGQVQCLITNAPQAAGSPTSPADTSVVRCQRSARGLTVIVDPMYGGPLTHDPKAVAALVDQAWRSARA